MVSNYNSAVNDGHRQFSTQRQACCSTGVGPLGIAALEAAHLGKFSLETETALKNSVDVLHRLGEKIIHDVFNHTHTPLGFLLVDCRV